jgi:hypothetical protein
MLSRMGRYLLLFQGGLGRIAGRQLWLGKTESLTWLTLLFEHCSTVNCAWSLLKSPSDAVKHRSGRQSGFELKMESKTNCHHHHPQS